MEYSARKGGMRPPADARGHGGAGRARFPVDAPGGRVLSTLGIVLHLKKQVLEKQVAPAPENQ